MNHLENRPAWEVMLVEDSFGDAILAQDAFAAAQRQINLSIACDGEEALEKLRRKPPYAAWPRPDLILLDLNLPRMDGHAVLRDIKNDPDLLAIPVIMMTGSNAAAEIDACYGLHANGCIVKPMHFERLEAIVSAIEQFWFEAVSLPSKSGRNHAT